MGDALSPAVAFKRPVLPSVCFYTREPCWLIINRASDHRFVREGESGQALLSFPSMCRLRKSARNNAATVTVGRPLPREHIATPKCLTWTESLCTVSERMSVYFPTTYTEGNLVCNHIPQPHTSTRSLLLI